MLGLVVMALLFIGTWAATHAPSAAANKNKLTTNVKTTFTSPGTNPGKPNNVAPQGTLSIENVFEVQDGDVEDNLTAAEDWNNINPPTVGTVPGPQQAITGPAGNAVLRTFINDEGTADQIFTQGGSKDFNDVNTAAQAGPTPSATPQWRHTTGSVPDKDEIDQAYAAKYIDPVSGDTVLVFGGTRHATNGDANIGFWFFQNTIGTNPNGTFTGFHTNGDLFLLSAFTGGGGTVGIRILVWVGSDPANPGHLDTLANRQTRCAALSGTLDPSGDTLCDITGTNPPGEAFVNNANTTAVWPYTPKGKSCGPNCIPIGASFEGGINLSDLNLQTECFSSFMLETRSSQSVDAVLKDFALGTFESCSVACTKVVSPTQACETDTQNHTASVTYTYTVSTPTGGASLTVSVRDDEGTPADTSDDRYISGFTAAPFGACTVGPAGGSAVTFAVPGGATTGCTRTTNVPVGTRTNIAHTNATVGTIALDECTSSATVTVFSKPQVSINVLTCPFAAQSSFSLTATATGGTPPYRIVFSTGEACGGSGEPACTGGNQLTITKTVGGSFTATVTDSSGQSNCSGTATRNVGYCSDGP
jgi:hypothetical protein